MTAKSYVYVRWLSAVTIVQNVNLCIHTHFFYKMETYSCKIAKQ